MITGIGHLAFTVLNMEESLKFYCEVLGFKKAFEITDDNGKPWIQYIKVRNGQFIELFYGHPNSSADQSYGHLCLEVDDINEIAARVKSFGIKLDVEPNQGKDTNYQCWVRDPDGNRIEFMQMSPGSPQSMA